MKVKTACFFALVLAAGTAWAGELRVGRAAVDITPPAGMPMGGYFEVRLNTGTHDALYAKALILEKDGAKAALVACDLAGLPRQFVEEARRLIEKNTGLRGAEVMISATHTHTGPEMSHLFLDLIAGAPAQVAKDYRAVLPGKIARAVQLAEADLKPARVFAGLGRDTSLSFNRRFFMKDGSVQFNPGKLNPEIVRPAGPIDPDIAVVYFDSAESQPVATFVNFAMHLDTVGGTEYSADYPFTLSKLLSQVKGPQMLTIFTIGTAGNINHLDVASPDPQSSPEEAARIGTILAGDVLETYKHLSPLDGPLRVRSMTAQLPLQAVKQEDVERGRALLTRAITRNEKDIPFMDLVHAFKALGLEEYHGKPIEAEVQVVALGDDLAWVGLPGEIFAELGLAIKLASPFRYTIINELAGDSIEYVPDLKAYNQDSYEVTNSLCAPGGGEILVDTARRLLVETHRRSQGQSVASPSNR